ncbi:hypothetical protein DE146DRAFT_736489 [Phaeosphaeria sp. MPI-PUGE-AT-0046c]|nr:hypothetical protein DE146DRAFT_736489 [Phaeosphaeria sp. MPI-PUGE-AT-0046c]
MLPTTPTSNDDYRIQVQNRVQDLIAGTRPRNLRLSNFSTRRLILEAVVEELRIFRLRRQREMSERAERERERKRRMKLRDCSREEHRHRHRHDRDGRGEGHQRHTSHSRHRNEAVRERREMSRSRDGTRDRECLDSLVEGHSNMSPEYKMSGGASPTAALREERTPRTRALSKSRRRRDEDLPSPVPAIDSARLASTQPAAQARQPRSPPRSHRRRVQSDPSPGQAGRSRPPPRQLGPDGVTRFGSVPRKGAGVGLATHFMNTYRHIKAEHEAGHRSKGMVERTMDRWRSKEGVEKLKKWDMERGEGVRRRLSHQSKDSARLGDQPPIRLRGSILPPVSPRDGKIHILTTNAIDVDSPTADPAAPPSPSPPLHTLPHISTPSPACHSSLNHASLKHSSLLSQIRNGSKLRRISSSQVKDKSTVLEAGHVYEATPHSKEVKAREREETVEDIGDGEEEVRRRRSLRKKLGGTGEDI